MWPLHAVVAAVFFTPALFMNRKRIHWERADYLVFFVPWLVWFNLFVFGGRAASLSSALVEVSILGVLVGLGFLPLIALAKRFSVGIMRLSLNIGLCLCAVAIWALVPFLGE